MKRYFRSSLILILVTHLFLPSMVLTSSADTRDIDVSYLQACLKTKGSTLDVLVLMDSSLSLRDKMPGEKERKNNAGSDPEEKRGKILKSSLKLLRSLAEDSNRDFWISLRNFGANSEGNEFKKLQEKWIPWSQNKTDGDLDKFINNALFDDSPGTQWANGLSTAKKEFSDRLNASKISEVKRCQIMFWITDGVPSDLTGDKDRICQSNGESSINWFREKNILVLGGLLRPRGPEGKQADAFRPIVTGENCGDNKDSWTRGEVIEADSVSDLAWGFVGLIANIKNLVNLNSTGSSFTVDPGTSQIEIFLRDPDANWQVKLPNGSVLCSKQSPGDCKVKSDEDIGITTITIFPENPKNVVGTWSITPEQKKNSISAYAGISTATSPGDKNSVRLEISSPATVEEGKEAAFKAKITNPDGSLFSLAGYKSVKICATLKSATQLNCKEGSASAEFFVSPIQSDKYVDFEAILTSAQDDDRNYRVTNSVSIEVQQSGLYPSLICKDKGCALKNLKNTKAKGGGSFEVVKAESGASGGTINILKPEVLSDTTSNREFTFAFSRGSGQVINPGDPTALLSPGETLSLEITTDVNGESNIVTRIPYEVVNAEGKKVLRYIDITFDVGEESNGLILALFMFLAYAVTVGIPYLYLLLRAKREAVLNVPDGEFSYLITPVVISQGGKVISSDENENSSTPGGISVPSHEKLIKQEVLSGSRKTEVGPALIEVIPPKWNPFVESKTRISIPLNHIMTTHGDNTFTANQDYFSSSLINETILYFPSDQNLNPESQSQVMSEDPSKKNDLFAGAYESQLKEELMKRVGDISANAIYIVPRFGNRRKSLEELTTKFKSHCESANMAQHIEELRKDKFEETVKEIEAAKAAALLQAEKESKNKKVKSAKVSVQEPKIENKKSKSMFDEDDKNANSKLWGSDDEDSPESETGRKLWD
jgi:hypothetical protein